MLRSERRSNLGVHCNAASGPKWQNCRDDQMPESRTVISFHGVCTSGNLIVHKVIYCAGCRLGHDRLNAERIIVRQTPCEIKVS